MALGIVFYMVPFCAYARGSPLLRAFSLTSMSTALRRAGRLLIGTLIVYGVLVASHKGEFWPFSIYPMFSQAGNDWSRAAVHRVNPETVPNWQAVSRGALPGTAFPLRNHNIDNIDLSNFVSKTEEWTPNRIRGLRTIFQRHLDNDAFLIVRVNGRLTDDNGVDVSYVPYVLLAPDTTLLNPRLKTGVATASTVKHRSRGAKP